MPRKKSLSRGDFIQSGRANFRREHGTFFSVSFGVLASGAQGVKASCVVSKKIAKNASDRNVIKRRCRAAIHGLLPRFEKPIAMIFYAKKPAKDAPYKDISREITQLSEKILARA